MTPKGKMTMKFFWNYMATAMLLAYLLTVGQAAEQPRPAKGQAAGTFQVKVSQGDLSLEANEAPLGQIFQEIGKQAKITVDSNIGSEEKVTIRLDRVPLEEGIKRLAKNVTVFYTETPKDKSRRISRVVVLSEGRTQSESVKESASKITKPAAQPEPFKFEFDPGKFAEKEKPRKQP